MKDWFARLRGKIRRSEDHFPKNLKLSDITPVSKKGNKNLARNYRTVSVLSTLSKLFVKIMRKQAWIMLILLSPISFRSSYRRCSMEKGALENFAKFTGKRLRPATLLKKRLARTGVFQWTLQDFQEHFFYRTPQDDWLLPIRVITEKSSEIRSFVITRNVEKDHW